MSTLTRLPLIDFADADPARQVNPFQPIGPGLPLTIRLEAVYTGDAPSKALGGRPDMIVVSGVKDNEADFNGVERALNQVIHKAEDHQYVTKSLFDIGTPIIYHTPSCTSNTVQFEVQLVADRFKEKAFKQIGESVSALNNVPLLFPVQSAMFVGNALVQVAGSIGKAVLNNGKKKRTYMAGKETINFHNEGTVNAESGVYLLCNEADEAELRDRYAPALVSDSEYRLVDKQDQKTKYAGDKPYVLVSLRGGERLDLAHFQPTFASAEMLRDFYGSDNHTEKATAVLSLVNDYHFLKKIHQTQRLQRDNPDGLPDNPDYFRNLLVSYTERIQHSELQAGAEAIRQQLG